MTQSIRKFHITRLLLDPITFERKTRMQNQMDQVLAFHAKLGISPHEDLEGQDVEKDLCYFGNNLKSMSNKALKLYHRLGEQRALRAHLMMEELGECLEALGRGDELGLLDGLADLEYVVVGTAVVHDLPLPEAFEEVHRSNMTKEKQVSDANSDRVREKGPNYEPPNLERVLADHRKQSHEN